MYIVFMKVIGALLVAISIVLIGYALYRDSNPMDELPVVTSVWQLSEHLGELVEIRGDIQLTEVSQVHTEPRTRGWRSIFSSGIGNYTWRWNLYIIELDDASIAFRGVYENFAERNSVTGIPILMQDDPISRSLLDSYTGRFAVDREIIVRAQFRGGLIHSEEDFYNVTDFAVGLAIIGIIMIVIELVVTKLRKIRAKNDNEAEKNV